MHRRILGLEVGLTGVLLAISSPARETDAGAEPALRVGEADSGWSAQVGAQLRPRVMVDTGKDFVSGSELREAVTQRARLTLSAEHTSEVKLLFQLQDVRTWGEESDTLADFDADGLDVHQVYGVLPIARGLELRLGRQEIVLDGARLVGNVGWTQRARSFDAARVSYVGRDFDIDGFGARVSEDDLNPDGNVPPGRTGDTGFVGVHARVEYWPGHSLAPVYLFNADAAADHNRHTAGALASGTVQQFHYAAEFYYQFGMQDTFDAAGDLLVNNQTIAAYLAAGSVGYTLDNAYHPDLTLRAELLSGDGTSESAFDTLYATNHKFYGEMDFYLNVPAHTQNNGLVDLGGQLSSALLPDLSALVSFHHFRTQQATATGSTLGNELDVKLDYRPLPYVSVEAFYGLFIPAEATRSIRSIPDSLDLVPESLVFVTTNLEF